MFGGSSGDTTSRQTKTKNKNGRGGHLPEEGTGAVYVNGLLGQYMFGKTRDVMKLVGQVRHTAKKMVCIVELRRVLKWVLATAKSEDCQGRKTATMELAGDIVKAEKGHAIALRGKLQQRLA